MDILHMTVKEIDKMSMNRYGLAVSYAWQAYTQRRVDFWLAKALGDGKGGKGNGTPKTMDWTALNPVYQEKQREKALQAKASEVFGW